MASQTSTNRRTSWLAAASISLAALGLTGAGLVGAPSEAGHAGAQPGPITAATTYGWYPIKWMDQFDHTRTIAPWVKKTSGNGTASILNEQIVLDSSPGRYSSPSHGNTQVVRGGPGQKYGRWEMRVRPRANWYTGGASYGFKVELVPAVQADRGCDAPRIGLGTFGYGANKIHTFVRNAEGTQWGKTFRGYRMDANHWHIMAVEVTRRHIAWFIDAHVVAKLTNDAAIPRMPLTMRLAMEGPDQSMDRTRMSVDWVRHFSMQSPNRHPLDAPAPRRERATPCWK